MQYISEAHADVKAAQRMGQLFDELVEINPDFLEDEGARHSLNVFFTRLLFCFFAEDTGVFADNQFTNVLGSRTLPDGSDTQELLTDLFAALDTKERADKPPYLADFPYVNGRLFSAGNGFRVPRFNRHSRQTLINLGTLIWQEINPDIFGSMFQAVVTPHQRSDLGQHYTSVPNILKTIEPLFLEELRAEFENAYENKNSLTKLWDRIAKIRVFDPACGSGNFLVIAYKELRRLEHAILERLSELDGKHQTLFTYSRINIENFYGLEIDDFPVEVAILSLWIAKHQMNIEFKEKFGIDIPLIPLKETGRIRTANAARMDWNEVCPNDGKKEIYLIGNPPYVGSSMQTKEQKADFSFVFKDRKYSKKLDYIALWFVKGADYIRGTNAQLAFVSTNSVAQGEHVGLMFPHILQGGVEIGFAHTSFKWVNNAKYNAGVTVVIIGLRPQSKAPKYLFSEGVAHKVKNINPYLGNGVDVIVTARKKPFNDNLPLMLFGSKPTDGGNLILSSMEQEELLTNYPAAAPYLRKFTGADDYINGRERYCIWVTDNQVKQARKIEPLAKRFERVAAMRRASRKLQTQKDAEFPYRFAEPRHKATDSIIVPRVSSERRDYIPLGYLGEDTVVSDAAFAVYDAEPWLFALLTSRMHMTWVRAVGGRLKTNYRYSNTLVYNTFPVPPLTEEVKEELTVAALRVLDVREYHCELTLAQLYDPDYMPANLRRAHRHIDELVDQLYGICPQNTDEQRLTHLFTLYQQALEAEAASSKKKTGAKKKA